MNQKSKERKEKWTDPKEDPKRISLWRKKKKNQRKNKDEEDTGFYILGLVIHNAMKNKNF